MHDTPAYGLWTLVIINSVFFIFFAASFSGLRWDKDWRSLGPYSAFIVALFTEMYGFPLTIYLLSGWLGQRLPGVDLWSHDSGHLWSTVFGLKGDPHWSILHLASAAVIGAGFWLLAASWKRLFDAQKRGIVATLGPYARVRHPQYVAFVLVMFGFLLQWPTIPTLVMFPLLVFVYARLARREEQDSLRRFGDAYARYMARVPAFIPKLALSRPPKWDADSRNPGPRSS
ncbi:MAG: isoprenylcysteine carboxylmethyltransferase family protein [Alsobacter sp.]